VEAEVRAYFGPLCFERAVPTSVKFREAYARGVPLVHYDRFSPGAAAYRAAAEAFLARGDAPAPGRRAPDPEGPTTGDDVPMAAHCWSD
jgi:chromosome partitioning protein